MKSCGKYEILNPLASTHLPLLFAETLFNKNFKKVDYTKEFPRIDVKKLLDIPIEKIEKNIELFYQPEKFIKSF